MDNALDEILSAAEGGAMTPALTQRLDKIADEVIAIDDETEKLELRIKEISKMRNEIMNKVIPSVLHQCGLSAFDTATGRRFTLETICSGSLPKEINARSEALKLIKEYGAEGIIKTEVSVTFGVGEYEQAEKAFEQLHEAGYDNASIMENVHPQTLAAFARERIKNNEPLDSEKLGLYVAQVAKIKVIKVR